MDTTDKEATAKSEATHFTGLIDNIKAAISSIKTAKTELHKLSGQPGVELQDLAAVDETLDKFVRNLDCFLSVDVQRFEACHLSVVHDDPTYIDSYVENNLFPHMDSHQGSPGRLADLLSQLEENTGVTKTDVIQMFREKILKRGNPQGVLDALRDKLREKGHGDAVDATDREMGFGQAHVISGAAAEALLRILRGNH